uniref:Uncharacterized protein n=1 Tax=Caenorhabditis tropicalis TaxID=1561998 RepID=A0A1I7U208_9PELO
MTPPSRASTQPTTDWHNPNDKNSDYLFQPVEIKPGLLRPPDQELEEPVQQPVQEPVYEGVPLECVWPQHLGHDSHPPMPTGAFNRSMGAVMASGERAIYGMRTIRRRRAKNIVLATLMTVARQNDNFGPSVGFLRQVQEMFHAMEQ